MITAPMDQILLDLVKLLKVAVVVEQVMEQGQIMQDGLVVVGAVHLPVAPGLTPQELQLKQLLDLHLVEIGLQEELLVVLD